MEAKIKQIVREMTERSDAETITFPEVVRALNGAGVERYHADLVAGNKVYYLLDDSFETTPCHKTRAPAREYSAVGVDARGPRDSGRVDPVPGVLRPNRGGRLRRLFRLPDRRARDLLRAQRRESRRAVSPREMSAQACNRGVGLHDCGDVGRAPS
jgi:hypothetical protein